MREIKFRAWDEEKEEMLEELQIRNEPLWWLTSLKLPIMQYTGMKDKNGTDVYEGDILQQYWRGEPTGIVAVEYWEHGFYGNDITRTNYDSETSEVIGNIYENEGLL